MTILTAPDPEASPPAARTRFARGDDAPSIARILGAAFPTLYASALGSRSPGEAARLLAALYRFRVLSLNHARVAVDAAGAIAGVLLLNAGEPIGTGPAHGYWRALRTVLPLHRAFFAFASGIATNKVLRKRIPSDPDMVYVEALAVDEPYRRRGVGRALMQDAEAITRRAGRAWIALHVMETNDVARRLYAGLGYRRRREIDARFVRDRKSFGAVLLAKRLHGAG